VIRFHGLPGTADPFVVVKRWDRKTSDLLEAADVWSRKTGVGIDINAIDNGTHGAGSFHGRSLAWDLDTKGDMPGDLVSLAAHLKAELPPPYEIVVEAGHVHVEWDTHRR